MSENQRGYTQADQDRFERLYEAMRAHVEAGLDPSRYGTKAEGLDPLLITLAKLCVLSTIAGEVLAELPKDRHHYAISQMLDSMGIRAETVATYLLPKERAQA
jgi:hypothetical protein